MDPRSAYREGATQGVSGIRLVICLYEQAVQDLRQAALAIEQGNIEARTSHINHALTVIGHLQSTLDRERGGQASRNLDRFYGSVRAALLELQVRVSLGILNEQISNLLSVREAWIEVEKATSKTPPPSYASRVNDALTASTDWKNSSPPAPRANKLTEAFTARTTSPTDWGKG